MSSSCSLQIAKKRLVNVSLWGWPIFGGGEQFLYDCMKWAHLAQMDVYWICFENANPNEPREFKQYRVITTEYGTIMQIPDGFKSETLKNWLKLLKPDVINHQGHRRLEVVKAAHELRIPCMTGACFWNEIIELDRNTYNKDIIKHAANHKEHASFRDVMKYSTVVYTASQFVTDAIYSITGVKLSNVIYSSSNKDNCKLFRSEKVNQHYVTLINYHEFKGGKILLELLQKLPEIPFLCIKTEYLSERLDKEIEDAIDRRNASTDPKVAKCKYIGRVNNIKDVLRETKILLVTSLVDETFCRTCNEAMANGIPVVTTGKGNLEYMIGDSSPIIDPENYSEWVNQVNRLYTNSLYYDFYSKKISTRYELFSEEVAMKQFTDTVEVCLNKNREMNVMIFAPWADQGLGIQGRIYVNILEELGFKTHIFSFKSYMTTPENPRYQSNPTEWEHQSVYYSENMREDVTDEELIYFIRKYNISKMILPEICFDRIFLIAELLKSYGVKTYAIPNIEICRKTELSRYNVFENVLCNNHFCEEILNNEGVLNTTYISHSHHDKRVTFKKMNKISDGDTIKFLNLGGLNAVVRKQCIAVCEAFKQAREIVSNIELTISIQGSQVPQKISQYLDVPGLTVLVQHLPYEDIIKLYHNSHISIQVSKHEGLGLGFYESLATGTPVITMDVPLHNEIINDSVNGWLIPCTQEDMKDNREGLVKSAIFTVEDLRDKIVALSKDYSEVNRIIRNTRKNYDDRFSVKSISALMYGALSV